MSAILVGLDVGGSTCAAVIGRSDGADIGIIERTAFATAEAPDPEACLDRLCALAGDMLARHGLRADAAGMSCGGPLDSGRGLVLGPPNLPGWDRVEATACITRRLGVPARLENDANAGAVAEWRWGAGRGCRSLAFLTMGTGMGAGLILDGRLYRGACDLAGEVGHLRLAEDGPEGYGKRGSCEGFCSGGGIARWAQAEGLGRITAQELFARAESGDAAALALAELIGERLGQGLALLIDLLNPERLILGSIFVRQRARLWPAAQRVIAHEALPAAVAACRVVPAELGEAIGDLAACATALEALP